MKNLTLILACMFVGLNIHAKSLLPKPFSLSDGKTNKMPLPKNVRLNKSGNMYLPGLQVNYYWDLLSNSWTPQDSIINNYNITGKVAVSLHKYFQAAEKTVYCYDVYGNQISDTTYTLDGMSIQYSNLNSYTYDDKGNQIETMSMIWIGNGWIPQSKSEFTFDSHNNILKTTYQSWDYTGNHWTIYNEEDFEYDSKNNQTQYISYSSWNGSSWGSGTKSVYVWDNGNLTEEISFVLDSVGNFENDSKYEYSYSSGRCSGALMSNWTGSTWENLEKLININWYQWNDVLTDPNNKIGGFTVQLRNAGVWTDAMMLSINYDSHGNEIDHVEKNYAGSTWVMSSEQKHLIQYDTHNNVTSNITQTWMDSITGLQNSSKITYGNYKEVAMGVHETSSNENINIYPNPSAGILHIYTSDKNASNISVYTITGKMVYQTSDNESTTQIDLTDMPKGFYFVRITNGNNVVNRKIILE